MTAITINNLKNAFKNLKFLCLTQSVSSVIICYNWNDLCYYSLNLKHALKLNSSSFSKQLSATLFISRKFYSSCGKLYDVHIYA